MKIEQLQNAIYCKFSPHGLSYQKCRLCGATFDTLVGLWKYAVRHYICEKCRDQKIEELKAAANQEVKGNA